MTEQLSPSRRRTRQTLFKAALDLLEEGARPTIQDIAERASVSRASAYRYFSDPAELIDTALAETTSELLAFDAGSLDGSAADRAEQLVARRALVILANEALFRRGLASQNPGRGARPPNADPDLGNAVKVALEPLESRLARQTHDQLAASLLLLAGPHAILGLRDSAALRPSDAEACLRWMARTLVTGAIMRDAAG
ncbi:Bacterial regulatory protein, tetR family [Hartmannibacter diazotrophicus]|uniref:Bacterial regulatory protein, tetR family n=1 Tax=Hartmannibacter diazotrophicus TaxID=1482074 RepID=A0A2C9D6L7_9HYPH|nr:TetR/AcrR family transcriptional regulator [Hartmannibacter diazotrophicus]SON55893.1 Bacterial regulatory protein, tetR family [Hartmannibacter diazotrophicus]